MLRAGAGVRVGVVVVVLTASAAITLTVLENIGQVTGRMSLKAGPLFSRVWIHVSSQHILSEGMQCSLSHNW